MNSLDLAMKHSCQVLRDTGTTQNAAGSPIPNLVPTDYKCLFSRISTSGNSISNTDAGKVKFTSIMVFLPGSAVVEKGDYITTTEQHWAGTYEVQDVDAPTAFFSDDVDHIEAFLKEVTKRG